MRRYSIVIPSYNEGKDLEATVALVRASCPEPHEIIVIDDCSTRPVRERLSSFPDVKVIRTEEQIGAGPAKRFGCENATGDAFIIMDAHMRMPMDWLAKIDEAWDLYPNAIFCTACRSFSTANRFIACGAEFSRLRDPFLGRRWLDRGPLEVVDRCPCLLGGCYIVPRDIWRALGGINPNFIGWGYGEQDLSLRAWMYGFEVRRINGLVVPHKFDRDHSNDASFRMSTWHNGYNAYVTAATVFSDGVFERLYLPYFKLVYKREALDAFLRRTPAILAFRDRVQQARMFEDDELYPMCRFRLPTPEEQTQVVEDIENHKAGRARNARRGVKVDEIERPEAPLIGRDHRLAILKSLPEGGRMLEWGCGPSTKWFREHMATSSIVSVEHNPQWAEKIGGVILHKMDLPLGTERLPGEGSVCLDLDIPYIAVSGIEGEFDVILVDGILRNACLLRAVDLLKPGGKVFLHDAERQRYCVGKTAFKWVERLPSCKDYPGPELWIGVKHT